jgi:hypothetical protein
VYLQIVLVPVIVSIAIIVIASFFDRRDWTGILRTGKKYDYLFHFLVPCWEYRSDAKTELVEIFYAKRFYGRQCKVRRFRDSFE